MPLFSDLHNEYIYLMSLVEIFVSGSAVEFQVQFSPFSISSSCYRFLIWKTNHKVHRP